MDQHPFVRPSVSVPRISAHIFVESDGVKALCESVLTDRRLANANATIQSGGLATAVSRYAHEPTPSLLVIEGSQIGAEFMAGLDQLASASDPTTRLIVLGHVNDVEVYRELLSRGISDYLVAPFTVSRMIQAILDLYAEPSQRDIGRTIAVMGARGGIGASAVAFNLAHALGERSRSETVLVDFDLPFGTAALSLDQEPTEGLDVALDAPERLDTTLVERLLLRCSEHLSLFSAPLDLDIDPNRNPAAYQQVVNVIKSLAPNVVLDLPRHWTPWQRDVLIHADEIVLVAGCDLVSLRNAKVLYNFLVGERPNDPAPKLVLNQVGLHGRNELQASVMTESLDIEPCVTIPCDSGLYFKSMMTSKPVATINASAPAAIAFNTLAETLAGFRTPGAAKKSGSMQGLFEAIKKKALANVWNAA
jgi:pilus assembly protein CpaE